MSVRIWETRLEQIGKVEVPGGADNKDMAVVQVAEGCCVLASSLPTPSLVDDTTRAGRTMSVGIFDFFVSSPFGLQLRSIMFKFWRHGVVCAPIFFIMLCRYCLVSSFAKAVEHLEKPVPSKYQLFWKAPRGYNTFSSC